MTLSEFAQYGQRWWRIFLVAVLGGLLAFAGSYAVSPTYEASTKLLIRARESTLLNSDGQTLSSQAGVVDGSLAVTLGQTQSALVDSTEVAERVVKDLSLDTRAEPDGGLLSPLKNVVSGTVRRARAYLTHGFYAEPSARDAAVERVHDGLTAVPLKDSYVLELTGNAETSALAAEVTNAAANALVEISVARFQAEAVRSRDFLAGQVSQAERALTAATTEKRTFEQAQGFTDLPADLQLGRASREDLRIRLQATTVDLRAATAQLSSLQQSLSKTPATTSGQSNIITGRSNTEVRTSGTSAVYDALRIERDRASGAVASLQAAQRALRQAVEGNSDATLKPNDRATYQRLDQRASAADATFQQLSKQHAEAELIVARAASEVTRVDVAVAPTFPVGPLRYTYLALGLLCGALGGWLLTWLSGRRTPVGDDRDPSDRSPFPETVEIIDLIDRSDDEAEVSVPGPRVTSPVARTPAVQGAQVERRVTGRFEVFRVAQDEPHTSPP